MTVHYREVLLYINLRRSRDFVCLYVKCVTLCVSYALHLLLLGSCYAVHINALSMNCVTYFLKTFRTLAIGSTLFYHGSTTLVIS